MYRTLLRQLRGSRASPSASPIVSINALQRNPNYNIPVRSYAFSSAEEAAAERRRRKRRLRIEPPKWALNPSPPPNNNRRPPGPPLPDTTSRLTGQYLSLHNRVQSLIRAGDLDSASAVARQAVFSKIRPTVFTCNAIISAMYRGGRHTDAISLFQYFFDQSNIIPNIVSYNFVILAHFGNSGDVDSALKTYNRILESAPFSPSCFTYRNLTRGLIGVGRIDDAVDMLREMLNKGQGADSLVYNNIISGFLELGNFEKANEFFEELQEKCTVYDGVVSATFMEWYFKQGKKKEAMEAYRYLMSKEFRMVPATCNVVLEVLVKYGMESEAWSLFKDMLDKHTPPSFQAVNSDTFNIMVNECFRLGKASEAIDVFKMEGQGKSTRPFAMDVAGFNNMIARLCEVDMFKEAEGYLERLRGKSLSPDVPTYRTFIEAYVRTGMVDEALEKYRDMVVAGLRVIPEYANKWFGFLVEKEKVKDCVPVLMKMCEKDPKPDVTTFEIVIKGLCETDEFEGCRYVVAQMMKSGVRATPGLREYLLSVFEKDGKLEAIQSILDAKFSPPEVPVPAWFEPLKSPPNEGYLSIFPPMPKKDGAAPATPHLQGPRMPWQSPVSSQMPQQASVGNSANVPVPGASHWQQRCVLPNLAGQGQRSDGPSQNSWQNSSANQFPGANSQLPRQDSFSSKSVAPSQWQQGSVSPHMAGQRSDGPSQNSWANSSGNQFPGGNPQLPRQDSFSSEMPRHASVAPSQWHQGSMPPHMAGQRSEGPSQNSWRNPSTNQFPGANSQLPQQDSFSPEIPRSQWQQGSVPPPSAAWQPSSANQFPGSYPGASQVPWQASVPSGMPQNSSTLYSPHWQGQSAGYSQTWGQTSQPQMPEQAAAAPEMPYDAVRHRMAK